jgi:phosphoglycerol transferase MdoB-like AlkP superfamily enzyme
MKNSLNWMRFAGQVQKDLKLWLACVGILEFFRICLILLFRDQMEEGTRPGEALVALVNGARFDSQSAGAATILVVLLSFACLRFDLEKVADRVRVAIGVGFFALTSVLGRINISYFREFHDQFNSFVLGVMFDDMGAVLTTISKEYSLVWEVLAGVAWMVAGGALVAWWLRSPFRRPGPLSLVARSSAARMLLVAVVVLSCTVAVRGSVGRRPVERKDAAISSDSFLNKVMLDPYNSLRYAWITHRRLSGSRGLSSFLPDEDIAAAARRGAVTAGPLENLDDALARDAAGPKGVVPRHLFLVIMESLDTWPMMERYASLGLVENLKAMAREGIWIRRFLPDSDGTMKSFSTIITGLADAGLMTNYQPTARQPYPSSIAAIFSRLGYRTRFFYSGGAAWERIGPFSAEQGFEEVYCGGNIGGWARGNEWGVDDEYLYRFVLETVRDDRPSFNLILTTSNHPPYDVDVYGKGFPLHELPERFSRGNATLLKLGHLWYSDRAVGDFARQVEKTLPRTLLAITGDHWSRWSVLPQPPAFERSSVPFILHGPEVLAGLERPPVLAGSHMDIGPTLVELAAPRGFRYHALGRDILASGGRPLAFGTQWILGPDFIVSTGDDPEFLPLPETPLPPDLPDVDALLRRYDDLYAVSWWRIKNGPALPPATP